MNKTTKLCLIALLASADDILTSKRGRWTDINNTENNIPMSSVMFTSHFKQMLATEPDESKLREYYNEMAEAHKEIILLRRSHTD